MYHLFLALFWIFYGCLHSIMATLWFKQIMQRITGKYFKWYRLFYSFLAALLLILVVVYQYSNTSVLLFFTPLAIKILTGISALIGLFIMGISIRRYFFMLSGVSVITNQPNDTTPLQQGINAYMRHPLYAGTLLVLWSLFFLFPLLNNLIACSIITFYTLIGIKLEERKLILEFGDIYASYKQKVPMLIPGFSKL
jgi:protein-S-isoprenylcysteine O-methyltransferase Ste14